MDLTTMTPPESFLAVLGVVLFFGLLLPQFLKPLHLPFATALILVGSIMGPNGLGHVAPDESLTLFGFLGAMFQMLLAGIEARSLGTGSRRSNIAKLLLTNGLLPGAAGVAIARGFGYDWPSSLFVGIVFLSSSILFVFGMIESVGLQKTRAGRLAKRVVVYEDIGASLLAFLLFQALDPHHRFPLPILVGLLLSSVIVLRMFLPEVVAFFFRRFEQDAQEHEGRLRLVVALLLLVIFAYSTLDVHPVIAAFLVGFALADVPDSAELRNRLEALGYGLFIPVFLFVIGLDTDLSVLWSFDPSSTLVVVILAGAVGSKLIGGYLGARWAGHESRNAIVVGVSSTAKLAVPLSATYAARDLGLLGQDLFTAIVLTAVATSMLAPLFLALITRNRARLEE
jgi:Kef-type K+ transport system membrane component KefB